jgi:hypothetical protein
MRNLSLPVVWEDPDTPDEWERDASSVPDNVSQGRYVFWSWARKDMEQVVMPFNNTPSAGPQLLNVSDLGAIDDTGICAVWNTSIRPPSSMGVLFRDPSNYELFKQGNGPFAQHMLDAGVAPTTTWPGVVYGTLPFAWGVDQDDTGQATLPNLEVV